MKHSFDSVIWVTDTEGNGYVCKVKDEFPDRKKLNALSEVELRDCEKVKKCASRHSLENLDNL